jgi:hypothetical protein
LIGSLTTKVLRGLGLDSRCCGRIHKERFDLKAKYGQMATAHLIHGFLGVGKTTFARQLEERLPAIRFTQDEWMARLYGDDPPVEHFAEFYRRVWEQMEGVWPRCLELGLNVVLDFGFGPAESAMP